jgi:IS30 family transposase
VEALYKALHKALHEALYKTLYKALYKVLYKALYKALYKTLYIEALHKALYKALYTKALHDSSVYNSSRLSKSDSAPVRGDGYKPGSSKFQIQSQRRNIAQRVLVGLVVVVYVIGRSKKFSHGMVRSQKPLQTVPLHNTAITVPLLSTYMI